MKRALGLIFIIAVCTVGFLSIRGTMPFMPILGSSMEPALQSGGLLMIKPVDVEDVKVGDIVVYNVPCMIREHYNYPPVVAHRVKEIKTVPGLGFRTAGDNTGEDPFTVRPQDLRGTVGSQIPYLGLPMLFFQSQQGLIFVGIAIVLLAFFLYGGELSHGGRKLHREIFAPVIDEEKRASRTLTRRIAATEQKISSTEQALNNFSSAIELYSQHLASHTSAIQGLSEASQELKRGAAEQNRVLIRLMENTEKSKPEEESAPKSEPAVSKPYKFLHRFRKPATELERLALERDKAAFSLKSIMRRKQALLAQQQELEPEKEKPEPWAVKAAPEVPEADEQQNPPGCARNRRPLTARKALKGPLP